MTLCIVPGGRHVCNRISLLDSGDLFHCLVIIVPSLQAGQLAITHGELDFGMTKQLLDGNDISTIVEQLGGHRVPKLMTGDRDAAFLRVILHPFLDPPY